MERLDTVAVVLAGLCLGLLGLELSRPPAVEAIPQLVVLTLGYLGLEVLAVPLPAFGFFSLAFPCALAAALTAGSGPASLMICAGLTLRSLRAGRPEPSGRFREALADALPALAGVGAAGALAGQGQAAGLAGAAAWALGTTFVPAVLAAALSTEENQSWGRERLRLLAPAALVGLLGPPLALLAAASPVAALAVPAVLGAFLGLARREGSRQQEYVSQLRAEKSQQVQQHVYHLEHARLEAYRKGQELETMERLIRALTRCESLTATLDIVLDLAARIVSCQSLAVFLLREGRPVPVLYRSPFSERLAAADLLELREPLVEQALTSRSPAYAESQPGGPRLFEGEPSALALPMEDEGVLYLGWAAPAPPSEEQRRLLGVVAAQGAVALQSARRLESRQETAELHRHARERLQRWVDRLALLLDGARAMAGSLEVERIAEQLKSMIGALVPHANGALAVGTRRWSWGALSTDEPPLPAILEAVTANRLPLLLEDVEKSRFGPLACGRASLLAVPLIAEQAPIGTLVLCAERPGAFDREDQDLLFMTGYLAAVACTSANRHQELMATHRLLKESQAQLVQAAKMAAVGQLAAGVAHELNTPLGAAMLGVDSARMKLDRDPRQAEPALNSAEMALRQAGNIVEKLLIYCREQGPRRQEADLTRVVEDTLALVRSQLEKDGVRIELALEDLPPVGANPSDLQQILTNLLINARDAVLEPAARSREIRVATGWDESRQRVRVQVEDGGPGIPADVGGRIFEPFFTTKPVGRGTGLGLSISQQIAAQAGGTLEAGRAPGGGARLILTLPVLEGYWEAAGR